jgi:hypothetical protein
MGRETTEHEREYLRLHTSSWEPVNIYQFVPDLGNVGIDSRTFYQAVDRSHEFGNDNNGVQDNHHHHQQQQQKPPITGYEFAEQWNQALKDGTKEQFEKDLPGKIRNSSAWVG